MNRSSYGNYPDLSIVKKILVVKLRHLGDVLLTAPIFSSLKKALPQAQLDAFIWAECAPMLEGHPALDNLLLYDRSWKRLGLVARYCKEFALLRHIRNAGYDAVINLTEGDRGALAALLSKAPIRLGPDTGKKGFLGKHRCYTHLVKPCPGPRHTVERHLDAVRRLGIFPREEDRELFLHVPPTAAQTVASLVGVSPFLVIHPASRWRFKCWPVPQMRALVQRLLERSERIVLTSGPDPAEKELVHQIASNLPVLNLAGHLSLKELAALLQQAKALICVDSAPLHMASALKTPVVALFGPTSEITWGPWQHPKARVVSQAFSCRPCYQDGCGGSKISDCLHTLSVPQVLAAYDSLF